MLKEKKAKTEMQICNIINGFVKDTGLLIDGMVIEIDELENTDGTKTLICTDVKIKVKI